MNRSYDNGAVCRRRGQDTTPQRDRSLAMVYSPEQKFQNIMEPMNGLMCGSIFRELIKPFLGSGRA